MAQTEKTHLGSKAEFGDAWEGPTNVLERGRSTDHPHLLNAGAFSYGGYPKMTNPRYANGNLRRKHRARLKVMGGECGICHGKLGPIHYDEPSDAAHPLSFVVDEIKPVSRYKEFGYNSKREAAEDWNNLQAAHYCCNLWKSNKVEPPGHTGRKAFLSDGDW